MTEGNVRLGSSLGTGRGSSLTTVPADGVGPPGSRMRETIERRGESVPKQRTGLRNKN